MFWLIIRGSTNRGDALRVPERNKTCKRPKLATSLRLIKIQIRKKKRRKALPHPSIITATVTVPLSSQFASLLIPLGDLDCRIRMYPRKIKIDTLPTGEGMQNFLRGST